MQCACHLAVIASLVACAEPELSEAPAILTVADQFVPPEAQPPIYLAGELGDLFSPVHATLLPDRSVMFLGVSYSHPGTKAAIFTPTPLGQAPPEWAVVDTQPIPVEAQGLVVGEWTIDDTPFCAGQTLLADGSLFVVGGTRTFASGLIARLEGVDYGITYRAGAWARITDRMKSRALDGDPIRWYPSATRLANGKVLVVGGRDYVATLWNGNFVEIGTENLSADLYDPATQTFATVSAFGATPAAIFNTDYSHVFQLPRAEPQDVLVFGSLGAPLRFSPAAHSWTETRRYRPGTALDAAGNPTAERPNDGASTVMLPLRAVDGDRGYGNGAVLVAGGTHFTQHERSVDIYDAAFDAWHPRRDLGIRRHHPSTVLLPDGNVLIVAGHDDSTRNTAPLIRRAQLVDTAAGLAISDGTAAMAEPRGYHNIALLLPDGRVLIGGGRDGGPNDTVSYEKPSIRYYHPPYLTRPRPALTWSPDRLAYGQPFWVAHDRPIADAVLIALGSMTHSIDMNQRSVQAPIAATFPAASVLIAPPDSRIAPPGHYMLFVLDAGRTPSTARIVEIGP